MEKKKLSLGHLKDHLALFNDNVLSKATIQSLHTFYISRLLKGCYFKQRCDFQSRYIHVGFSRIMSTVALSINFGLIGRLCLNSLTA